MRIKGPWPLSSCIKYVTRDGGNIKFMSLAPTSHPPPAYPRDLFERKNITFIYKQDLNVAVSNKKKQQECIPIGCVPPAGVAVGGGSASVHVGIHPPPWVWAWRPPRCGPGVSPLARPLNFPPGCGPGNLQGMLGYHPPETCCKECWDTTCNACWDTPP